MDSLIGKEIRRITFTLYKEQKYYLLLSVMEEMHKDFQDFNDFRRAFVCERINRTSKHSEGKIYMSIDFLTISKDLLSEPYKNYILQDKHKTEVICAGNYQPSPKASDCWCIYNTHGENTLLETLPERKDTHYIKVWKDMSYKIPAEVLNSKDLIDQLSQLSLEKYGINLYKYPDVLGNIYLIAYNPYYRNLDVSMSENPAGIYVDVEGIRRTTEKLKIEFINRDKDGGYEYAIEKTLDLSKSKHFFDLSDAPDKLEIIVKDEEGQLVDAIAPISFIKGYNVTMNIASSRISIPQGKIGNEVVQKFVSESFGVGKTLEKATTQRDELISIHSAKEAYEVLERSLEFAFFDGSKDQFEMEENKKKAVKFVRNILSRAKQKCMVADPYFNLKSLSQFIFTMPQSEVTVRILGSKEHLNTDFEAPKTAANKKEEIENIQIGINSYRNACPSFDIQFKLLKGDKSPLHDRYIIVDDDVWMIGTSFNEIGVRASSIIKLPKVSANRISAELESWWTDNNISEHI